MSTPTKRVAFHTLGCKLNFSETAMISRDFIKKGFEKVSFKDESDIYVINTCSVTENADKEARKLIRQAKRRNPNSSIAIIGCYAQLKPDEIAKIDDVDLILGAGEKFNLLNHLDRIELNKKPRVFKSDINKVNNFIPSYSANERTRSFLKVQDGCNYACTFCTIPLARGRSRSGSIENTLMMANKISKSKSREIVLTGVNIGDFGNGINESFFDLIVELDNIENIDRIRISSIEPNLLTNEIIEFCAKSKKFMPHFHIPLQSGSNKILSLMQRRYNREKYKNRISMINKIIPDACIGVDVIVGFPGEKDGDFLDTYNFLDSLNISYLHVFTYSERDKTRSVDFIDVVDKNKRTQRSKMLHELSIRKRDAFDSAFLNKNRPVLFETVRNDRIIGHTDNYILVDVEGNKDLINSIYTTQLISSGAKSMRGKILSIYP